MIFQNNEGEILLNRVILNSVTVCLESTICESERDSSSVRVVMLMVIDLYYRSPKLLWITFDFSIILKEPGYTNHRLHKIVNNLLLTYVRSIILLPWLDYFFPWKTSQLSHSTGFISVLLHALVEYFVKI